VVSKDDVIRYMLSLSILNGRISKWILALSEFDLTYESTKAVKGQVMANFVVQHCGPEFTVLDLLLGPCSSMVLHAGLDLVLS
jgi:hypothetical protein